MGISVADNFDHKSKKPLDARTSYSTLALMKAVTDANMNEGCLAYCAETDKYYKFLSTNTVDESTGKWREFSSGGGGGSTYTAGDGIDITNDVISTKQSEEGDIDEIIGSLPSGGMGVTLVNAFNKSDLYSTEEKMIGQWVDSKPLYQKTFEFPMSGGATEGSLYYKQLNVSSLNIDSYVSCEVVLKGTDICKTIPVFEYVNSVSRAYSIFGWKDDIVQININEQNATLLNNIKNSNAYITIKYTKTTDSAVSIGTANEYSTDEKIVGTWITGEPIYQKTWTGQTTTGTEVDLFSLTGANKIIDIDGYLHNDGYYFHFNYAQGTGNYFSIFVKDNVIKLRKQANTNYDYAITVQYTKTT